MKIWLGGIAILLLLSVAAEAALVTLTRQRTGPIFIGIDGNPVSGGLIRMGSLSAEPASNAAADIDAVFDEFATNFTTEEGFPAHQFHNNTPEALTFNGRQIYFWVFDSPDLESSRASSLLTVANPGNPREGVGGFPWIYRVAHNQSYGISTFALLGDGADPNVIRGPRIEGHDVFLTVPEPSSALLIAVSGLILFRRRR